MLPFQSYDPNAEVGGGFRPPRLISSKADSKSPTDIAAGDNQFYLLPSCSDWERFRAAGWHGYFPGAFYTRVTVKSYADKFARSYRTKNANNHLTAAYWQLYNAILPNKGTTKGTPMEKIKDSFDAGIDYRCLVNLVRNTRQGLSGLLWMDMGAEKPGTNIAELKRKSLLTQTLDAVNQIATNTGGKLIGFELEQAVLLKLGVQFNGSIAQYNYVMPEMGPNGLIVNNLVGAIPDFDISQLEEIRAWAAEEDELPPLDQIPALVENPMCCEILKIQTNRVPGNPSQSAGGFSPQGQPPVQQWGQPPAQQWGAPAQQPPVQQWGQPGQQPAFGPQPQTGQPAFGPQPQPGQQPPAQQWGQPAGQPAQQPASQQWGQPAPAQQPPAQQWGAPGQQPSGQPSQQPPVQQWTQPGQGQQPAQQGPAATPPPVAPPVTPPVSTMTAHGAQAASNAFQAHLAQPSKQGF